MEGDVSSAPLSADLLARSRRGDEDAIDQLCREVRPRLERFVARRLSLGARRWVSVEDVVQPVLLEAVKQLPSLPEDADEDEFLRRLHRTAGLRVKDAARNVGFQLGESVLPAHLGEPALAKPVMGSVTGADYRGWLEELVARLPPKYAEVVRLCAFEELSCVDAGKRLGLSGDTVRKRYEVARSALDRRLSDATHD